jgi:uncharacterized membrane protein YraQ (UPF0718 family)/copper chaperone CopZ
MLNLIQAMWEVLLSLAPWMLLGMAIAGMLHVALPRGFVRRQLGGRGGVAKAVALGVPLPLCSCGVIPTALGLKRDGATDGATVGFLISTPQTGVDSILVSSAFLGWPFAIFKVLSAAVTGIVGGYLTDAAGGAARIAAETDAADGIEEPRGLRAGIDHAMEILRSIWHWIVFGVVASALIELFVPQGFFTGLSGYGAIVPVFAALAISLPLYVCSTASVPIAAALVAGGMPAGAALVFLMAGPATNVATIGAIYRALGRRTLAIYLGTIIAGSLAAAFLFDFVIVTATGAAAHLHGEGSWWAVGSSLILLGLLAWFALDDLRRLLARWFGRQAVDEPRIEIGVTGMSCGGCAAKLEKALINEKGVAAVEVTLNPGRAVVSGSIDIKRLREIIEQVGFETVETQHG